jgi:hypothetical protein
MGWADERGSHLLTRSECMPLFALHAAGVGLIGLVDFGLTVRAPPVAGSTCGKAITLTGGGETARRSREAPSS